MKKAKSLAKFSSFVQQQTCPTTGHLKIADLLGSGVIEKNQTKPKPTQKNGKIVQNQGKKIQNGSKQNSQTKMKPKKCTSPKVKQIMSKRGSMERDGNQMLIQKSQEFQFPKSQRQSMVRQSFQASAYPLNHKKGPEIPTLKISFNQTPSSSKDRYWTQEQSKMSEKTQKRCLVEKQSPPLRTPVIQSHKRVSSQMNQDLLYPVLDRNVQIQSQYTSISNSSLNSYRSNFQTATKNETEDEFAKIQHYFSNALTERNHREVIKSKDFGLPPRSRKSNEFRESFNYQDFQGHGKLQLNEQLEQIRKKQQEKQQQLIDQFDLLRTQAKEALQSTQFVIGISSDMYEKRMSQFENIIEQLMEKQKQTEQELIEAKSLLLNHSKSQLMRQNSKTPLRTMSREEFDNQCYKANTFGCGSLESSQQSLSSKITFYNNNNFQSTLGQQMQNLTKQNEIIFSQASDNRLNRNINLLSSIQGETSSQREKSPQLFISSIKPVVSHPSTTNVLESKVTPSVKQVSSFSMSSTAKQNSCTPNTYIKAFLDTLQNLEEANNDNNVEELNQIKTKLKSYRDQLVQTPFFQSSNKSSRQMMQALEILIHKLDLQKENKKPHHVVLNLDEENVLVDTSVDKTKILCDTSNLSPTLNFSQCQGQSNQFMFGVPATNNFKGENNQDISAIVNTSQMSALSQRQAKLSKICNRSGFQVKHSLNGSKNSYQVEKITVMDTLEELKGTDQGWHQEVKHIYALLGVMNEDMGQRMDSEDSNGVKENCKIL